MKTCKIALLFFLFFLFELLNAQNTGRVVQLDSGKYLLRVVRLSSLNDSIIIEKRLPYEIFRFEEADINGDGQVEYLIGAIKKTPLDTFLRKRINIWKVENNQIVPMWLGSKMPQPLYDFEIQRSPKFRILTIEYERDGLFLVAEYEWRSFGLKFIRYLQREILLKQALTLINNNDE